MNIIMSLRRWASALKRQVLTLWFCYRHPQTPWLPKSVAICVVAYALSPIDLIPDFIPVLGYLDDVILLPLGILLVLRLMPADILEVCRSRAREWEHNAMPRPTIEWMAVLIVLIWMLVAAGLWLYFA
jgi:uncharacterized membrane protein YkvA (DUF1232 family)